ADVSYITPSVARSYAIEVLPHPHPYHPIGANGKPFNEVREFDILDLGGMHVVLGKNWLQVHNPDVKASNNFYPIFTEKACEGHRVNNAHAPCSLAVTMVPRACSQLVELCTLNDTGVVAKRQGLYAIWDQSVTIKRYRLSTPNIRAKSLLLFSFL
ncbi:hypothetical protein PROFUN_14345, partial [Planoprotostelium fungivorum]